MMADFTETPHAEDFAMELGELIDDYEQRGLDPTWIRLLLNSAINDLEPEED